MKQWKNNLDERQEQALEKIEGKGCWLAFWGLLIALLVQLVVFRTDFKPMIGEAAVFLILSGYLAVGCLRLGIWDRRLQPNVKTNLLVSLVVALIVGAVNFVVILIRFPGETARGAITALICMGITFLFCFGVLSLFARVYKKRRQALESEPEE